MKRKSEKSRQSTQQITLLLSHGQLYHLPCVKHDLLIHEIEKLQIHNLVVSQVLTFFSAEQILSDRMAGRFQKYPAPYNILIDRQEITS